MILKRGVNLDIFLKMFFVSITYLIGGKVYCRTIIKYSDKLVENQSDMIWLLAVLAPCAGGRNPPGRSRSLAGILGQKGCMLVGGLAFFIEFAYVFNIKLVIKHATLRFPYLRAVFFPVRYSRGLKMVLFGDFCPFVIPFSTLIGSAFAGEKKKIQLFLSPICLSIINADQKNLLQYL